LGFIALYEKDTYGMLAELWRKWATASEQLDNQEQQQ